MGVPPMGLVPPEETPESLLWFPPSSERSENAASTHQGDTSPTPALRAPWSRTPAPRSRNSLCYVSPSVGQAMAARLMETPALKPVA